MQRAHVSVQTQVAATTSNLGPGYDTLGVALRLYNRVKLTPNGSVRMRITSPLATDAVHGARKMVEQAAALFFQQTGKEPFGCDVYLAGDVPVARGLGSSVTVRLGVLAGLDALAGTRLPRQRFLELITSLEHHPDNAAPAIFGGFTVAGSLENSVRCLSFPVSPRAWFVALIPSFEISTQMARRLVPRTFSRADTVHNLNRAALISAAFAGNRLTALAGLFDDRVHQPYREKLIPQLNLAIQAGVSAGALGGWLSGSGSTIICLTLKKPKAVATAMLRQLPNARTLILLADNDGYQVRCHR